MADSILDYVDLGCDLISIRGYDNMTDMIDYGRHVLPRVREGLAARENGSVAPASEAKKGQANDLTDG